MTTRHVALLYSVVLGPARRVRMDALRDLAAGLGFAEPRTLLSSGNLVIDAATDDPQAVEQRLEPAFAERFGREIPIIVRPAKEWPLLVAANPFPEESGRIPARVAVRVMRMPLDPGIATSFDRYLAAGEKLRVVGGDLWALFPNGQGASKLAAAMTPARTGGAGTFRNWNTVLRIDALLRG